MYTLIIKRKIKICSSLFRHVGMSCKALHVLIFGHIRGSSSGSVQLARVTSVSRISKSHYDALRGYSSLLSALVSRHCKKTISRAPSTSSKLNPTRFWFHDMRGDAFDHMCPGLLKGHDHIRCPSLNKGMGFTLEERQLLGIHGLLPPKFKTQEEQVNACLANLSFYTNDLNKYIYLVALQDRNERLFYRLVSENVEQMLPIVYTPTVGQACLRFGLIFRRPRGLFISRYDKGRIRSLLRNWPEQDVRAIVMTDGERILGLGDLGAYGMGIPVGKLSLYTALGGIKPHNCLPIVIDVGTNNQSLLEDPYYIGVQEPRLTGTEYDEVIDELMEAIVSMYGTDTLIQFEDFANQNAFRLLKKYQKKYCVFNDDIQGTAGVILAGLTASLRITKKRMSENTFLFLGAGGAALGIAGLIHRALVLDGLSEKEAADRIWISDMHGLITKDHPSVSEQQKRYVKDAPRLQKFIDMVKLVKPTAILGASAQAGAFNSEVLETMAQLNEKPIVFALSNPTSKAECTAADAYRCTEGRAIFASGSPFPPVEYNGRTFYPSQGNNAYIFPGVALGVLAAGIRYIDDDTFFLAANTLAGTLSDEELAKGRLYPSQCEILRLSKVIGLAILEDAFKNGKATTFPEPKDKKVYIESLLYDCRYTSSVPEKYSWPAKNKKAKP